MIISLSKLAGVLGVTHDLLLRGSAFGSLSNEQARAFVGRDEVALTEHVRALGASGDDERSVAMFLSRRELKKVLPFLALGLARLGDEKWRRGLRPRSLSCGLGRARSMAR